VKKFFTDFYGIGTVGERGQVVIPAEAREKMKIKSGDKFVFFGHAEILHIIKVEKLDSVLAKIAEKFNSKINNLRNKIKKNRKEEEAND
jgi:AbrB family looped-hinge helix DNA binding protein